jgi:hypothetical protein
MRDADYGRAGRETGRHEAMQTMEFGMPSVSPHQLDAIQAALAARGYTSEILSAFRSIQLPAGSTMTFQFGDEIVADPKGRPKVNLQTVCQVNADDVPSAGVVSLGIEKSHQFCDDRPFLLALKLKLQLGIDADFHLPRELERGGSAIQRVETYVFLQSLLSDACETIKSFSIDPADDAPSGPAMRIEARLLGDIALGRSGVVRSIGQAASADYVRFAAAACEWLRNRVLPELRCVVHDVTKKGRAIVGHGASPFDNLAPRTLPFADAIEPVCEVKTIQ